MSTKAQDFKSPSNGLDVLDFYEQFPVIQFSDESNSDDAIGCGTTPDYVVITNDSILCVTSKAEADQFRRSCAERYCDDENQSILG